MLFPLLGILPDIEQVVIAPTRAKRSLEVVPRQEKPLRISATGSSRRVFPTWILTAKRDFSAAYSGDRRELVWVYFQAESRTPASLQKNVCQSFNGRTSELFSASLQMLKNDLSAAAGKYLTVEADEISVTITQTTPVILTAKIPMKKNEEYHVR